MASSSTSSVPKSFKYDVFLSFRGEDTRNNFIGHLYQALQQKDISTFKDDEEIKMGKVISDELIGSIKESRFYIIVFSKNYASSSWCLGELVEIMECLKTSEQHTAYPVFYDVEPTEVRWQTGAVGEAFSKHKDDEAAGKWKEALKEAANLSGRELKMTANGDEAKFIKEIVKAIAEDLPSINFGFDDELVGMDTRVKDVISLVQKDIDDFSMIGIWGIGGGGKTTLARAVFDQVSFRFDGNCFVDNVREVSKDSSGFAFLQTNILKNILNVKDIHISSFHDGKRMMKMRLCRRKVLLVLDDVDNIEQLKALAGDCSWFGAGSRIIITTRDSHVLHAHRVKWVVNVNLLSRAEAICLFCKHAFGGESPSQEYEELLGQIVHYAAGLPLTIRVLGSFLCSRTKSEWIDTLERLKTIPLIETLQKLELSYLSLEKDHKEIFLNVACIMKGWYKNVAIEALESCGLRGEIGLKVLEEKALITTYITTYYGVSDQQRLGMHDHLEEMGRNIVRRKDPEEPEKHSRLWFDEEIENILANDLGTEATRYISFSNDRVDLEIVMKGLTKMQKLMFLHVAGWIEKMENVTGRHHRYDHDIDYRELRINNADTDIYVRTVRTWKNDNVSPYFPNALKYLNWSKYPLWCLPNTFQGNNLVVLRMFNSNIEQLWEGEEKKVLNKLKILVLRDSKIRTLDLSLIPNLEVLNLGGCREIQSLNGCLKLKSVDLSDSKLKTVDLRLALNLEVLHLKECHDLVQLDLPVDGCLKLKSVDLSFSKLKTVDLRSALNLEVLHLKECHDLVQLHLPVDECLKLKSVDLKASKLKTVDLRSALNVEVLHLKECHDLVELHLPVDGCLKLKSVNLSASKLKTVDLRSALNLEVLHLKECHDLVQLHLPVDVLLKLKSVDLNASKLKTVDFRSALNVEVLHLKECHDVVQLHLPVDGCLKLTHLLCTGSKLMTLDLGPTPNLQNLDLKNCRNLEEVHMPGKCQRLTSLNISHTKLKTFDLGMTPNLKRLDLKECNNLVKLQVPTGCLENIIHLDLSGCLRFTSFVFDKDVGAFAQLELPQLELSAESLEKCPLHPDSTLPKFQFRCVYINDDYTSSSARNLERLISVGLCACTNTETFSGSICGLRGLRRLKIQGYQEAPKDLGQLECLEELWSTKTYMKHLPHSICMLKHLKVLNLDSCWCLRQLPEDIGQLECLEWLTLSYAKITHLPDSICRLKHLKFLVLKDCFWLEKLPEELGRLECLNTLNLSYTKIKHLPDSICMLKHLKFLILFRCSELEKLPKDFGLLECLKSLSLSSPNIKHLPDDILMLRNLKKLTLDHCSKLEKLPEDLDQLERLKFLSLKECKSLRDIPTSICKMKRLKSLDVSNTCISHLPDNICLLKGLYISGPRALLESFGFTSKMQTYQYEDSCSVRV